MYEEFEERIGLRTTKPRKRERTIRESIYIYWARYIDFFYSPRVNFIYDAVIKQQQKSIIKNVLIFLLFLRSPI